MTTTNGRVLQRSEHRALLLAGDLAVAAAAVVLALWTWNQTTSSPFDLAFARRWSVLWLLAPTWALLLAPARQARVALAASRTWRVLLGAAGTIAAAYLLAYFYAPRTALPRLPILYFLWDAVLLTLGWRLTYIYAISRGLFRRRALVIGSPESTTRFRDTVASHAPDMEVVATATPAEADARLAEFVPTRGVTEIILDPHADLGQHTGAAVLRWQEQGLDVIPMAAEYEHVLARVAVPDLPPDWAFTALPDWVRAHEASRATKRAIDIVCGAAGLVVLAGVTPFVALATLVDTGRPVFYRQRRLGMGGRIFEVLKFRTMKAGAEADGPRWADAADPRVTRVGRWLRRSRLDELPQVLNILRGDMSVVGPRPERPEFADVLERQIPFYRTRLSVRPGLTGWAQVNAPYVDSVEASGLKLEYDLYYIKHRSLWLDLWIVLRTVATVFSLGGR